MGQYEVDPIPVGWYLTAFSDEIETGQATHLHYFGKDLVAWRGKATETVYLAEAYCPHQGAHLGHGGLVVKDEIVCPFHSWRFDQNGVNTHVPNAPTVPEARLCTLPTHEVDGMVFAWFHPHGEAPTWEPPRVPEFNDDAYSVRWRTDPIDIHVHLQDVLENAVDAAHFPAIHRSHKMPRVEITQNEGPHFIAVLPDQKLRSDRGPFDATVSSELWGLGIDIARMESDFMSIIYVQLATPVDEGLSRFWFHITLRRKSSDKPVTEDFVAHIGEGLVAEFMQDYVVWEHKVYRPTPLLSDYEEPVREFRRWARQFYPNVTATAQEITE